MPVEVSLRDNYRIKVAKDVLPKTVPVALQYGLWGVTPWRPNMVFLNEHNALPQDYIFVDFHEPHGLDPGQFIRTIQKLKSQVLSGKRKVLHDRYDILILSPEMAGRSGRKRAGGVDVAGPTAPADAAHSPADDTRGTSAAQDTVTPP
jgi:hypothetical protein